MSDKTDYKRLWKADHKAAIIEHGRATACLKAMNLLLNTIQPKFTATEWADLLKLIGADQVEAV